MEPLPWYRIATPIVLVLALIVVCIVRSDVRFRAMLMGSAFLAGYGMLQDQISARLCIEYFTVLHAPIPNLTNPTLVGIAWGFLGSWWGGAIMGYVMGIVATVGTKHPPLRLRQLVWPMVAVVLITATATALAGISVWRHTEMLELEFASWLDRAIPRERQRGAFIVANYHLVAYGSAIISSVAMSVWVGWYRSRVNGV